LTEATNLSNLQKTAIYVRDFQGSCHFDEAAGFIVNAKHLQHELKKNKTARIKARDEKVAATRSVEDVK